MSLLSRKKPENSKGDVRDLDLRASYDATVFNGTKLLRNPESEHGHLWNLQLISEASRLDANERLDTLIELQRETLETQKAILEELRKR